MWRPLCAVAARAAGAAETPGEAALTHRLDAAIARYKEVSNPQWAAAVGDVPDRSRDVFVNREVTLAKVSTWGFDYD